MEKAYAKMYGSYQNIVGGFVSEALRDLTNGCPERYTLNDPNTIQMKKDGSFWIKLKYWINNDYLMGSDSPDGSD